MSDIKINIKGLAELETKLLNMGQELAAKSIVSAAYTANKPVVDAAKANLVSDGLVDTGLLHNSITRKKIVYAKDGRVVIITGVNKATKGLDKKGQRRVPWRYANVLEPKYRFMAKAQETTAQGVVDKFVGSLERKIKKFIKGK